MNIARGVQRQAVFLAVYALQQAVLVALLTSFPQATGIIVSMFVITFATAFSMERLLLERRLQQYELEIGRLKFTTLATIARVREYNRGVARAIGKRRFK